MPLLPPPPLRTVLATFTAHGSSKPIRPSNNIAVMECQIDGARSEHLTHVSHSPSNRTPATRVSERVFGVAVSEIVPESSSGQALNQPQVMTLIGQVNPAGMPQHVGMKRTESGTPGSSADEVVDRLPGHRLPNGPTLVKYPHLHHQPKGAQTMQTFTIRAFAALFVCTLALLVAACGSDDDSSRLRRRHPWRR